MNHYGKRLGVPAFHHILSMGILLSTTLISSQSAASGLTVVSTKDSSFIGPVNSGLVDFKLREIKKTYLLPGDPPELVNYFTDIRAVLRNQTPFTIEKFVIVQWIKGCQFESYVKSGRVVKDTNISRDYFGNIELFKHVRWQVDSDNSDPVYSSYEGFGRFGILRWNEDPTDWNPETANWYAEKKPTHGVVYVTDLPGPAVLIAGKVMRARNSSLEFKTCVFRETDIPKVSTPDGAGIDRNLALGCLNWSHKYVYSHQSKKFVEGGVIDPICLKP